MKLTRREMEAFSKMVNLASESFACHGCNDLEREIEDSLTPEEWEQFLDRYSEMTGDERPEFVDDWMILDAVAAFMKSEAKEADE